MNTSPLMQAAEKAAKIVASWSKSKQEYARRVLDSGRMTLDIDHCNNT